MSDRYDAVDLTAMVVASVGNVPILHIAPDSLLSELESRLWPRLPFDPVVVRAGRPFPVSPERLVLAPPSALRSAETQRFPVVIVSHAPTLLSPGFQERFLYRDFAGTRLWGHLPERGLSSIEDLRLLSLFGGNIHRPLKKSIRRAARHLAVLVDDPSPDNAADNWGTPERDQLIVLMLKNLYRRDIDALIAIDFQLVRKLKVDFDRVVIVRDSVADVRSLLTRLPPDWASHVVIVTKETIRHANLWGAVVLLACHWTEDELISLAIPRGLYVAPRLIVAVADLRLRSRLGAMQVQMEAGGW